MKKSRFTESQIVAVLKEADAGKPVKEICRQHGISDATYYKWKSKYGGMEAFKNTLLNVKSVTYAPAASTGRNLPKVLDRLGIGEQMKAKTKPNALARVPQVVAAGKVELAIAGIPILLSVKGVQIVGLLPGELQSWFVNTAGVSAAANQPDAAKALIQYLATPEASVVIKAKGMEPLAK